MRSCPFGPCDNCVWLRTYELKNKDIGEIKREELCGLEVMLRDSIQLRIEIDGLQAAINEARNAVWGMAAGMAAHGFNAPLRALQTKVGDRILASLKEENPVEIEVDPDKTEQIE